VRMFARSKESVDAGVKAAQDQVKFLTGVGIGKGEGKIQAAYTLADCVKGVDIVFESVAEELEIKRSVLREVEDHAPPSALLCTNTSSLSVTAIAEALKTPERFCAAHFIGPAHLVPLVEVCPAAQTGPDAVPRVAAFLRGVGKKPVEMKKEIQGFLAARLQAALYRECMHIVNEGAAEPEAVDSAVVNGFGRRLNQIGPFQQADFAGVDLLVKTHGTFFPQLGAAQRDTRSEALAGEGRVGAKCGKGNYEWPEERKALVMGRRDAELLRRLQQDVERGE